jgi:hypothetical protein
MNCSHAITFRNEFKGVTNIHYDEVLTVPVWPGHLRVQKSALCSQQLLTYFCAYWLFPRTMWNSARTSVTAAPMSMAAMASILKVFLIWTKERKGYSAEQRRQKQWEKRDSEVGQGRAR